MAQPNTPHAQLVALGQEFVRNHPPPGRLVLCAITGSHIYGFSSPDSDIDLKGIHQVETARLLGIGGYPESFDHMGWLGSTECDLTTQELGRAVGLLLRGNGNMLEQIWSPIQAGPAQDVAELQALTPHFLSRAVFGHYAGFFKGSQREFERDGRAKSLLYTWRVALTGLHLLRTGRVECDLRTLWEGRKEAALLQEVIAFKQENAEKARLPGGLGGELRALWPALDLELRVARDSSPLPLEPPGKPTIDAWLVSRRKADLLA
jgi:predicted nucleotidyltransferase